MIDHPGAAGIRRRLPFLTLWLCWTLVGCASTGVSGAPTGAPPSFPGLDLAAHRGKVVYIDFWASWCAPCLRSFPWMNAMQEKYRDAGLVIIAVNVDRRREAADDFLSRVPASFELVYDPAGKLASEFDLGGMPCSFLVDRRGILRGDHVGFRGDDAQHLEQRIRSLLEENADESARSGS
jgi:thiol-disulfide isomerase/thioredoxin